MGKSHQRGWVVLRGKMWYGYCRRTVLDPTSNQEKVETLTVILGQKSQMSKFQARERLELEIAKALDQSGTQRFDVTWSVNNPSLASFTSGSPMILTATGEGVVTLTATVEGVSGQLQITITPSWLQVTPTTVNMYATGTQQFTAVDNLGRPASDVTWTLSNSSLATITNANPTVLTATTAGSLTLTATVEGVSAQAQITISPVNTVFPSGTILWSVPPAPGFTAMQIAQAVPTAGAPALYSTSISADGTQSIIQALQADGEQLWQSQMPAVLNNSAVPDGSGGLIVTSCPSGNPMTVSDLSSTGQVLWQELAAGVNTGNGTITYLCNAPYIAVRGDGAVVVTEATNVGLPSVTLNGQMYPIPPSTVTNYGNTIDVLCCVGPPMVNTDGTAYLEYEVRNTVNNVVTSDTLYLMQINPDNSSSSTILSSTTQNETQYPGNIIPDGNGGVLATWSVSVVQGTQLTYPYQAVDFSGGAVGTPYNLPFSPQSVNIAKQPSLVLGQNGVAFASGTTTATVNGTPTQVSQIALFNVSSGAPNWTYQAAPGSSLTIIAAGSDGGISITDSQNGIVHLDASGNPWPVTANLGGTGDHSWTGQWFLQNAQGSSSLFLPIDVDPANVWPSPGGDPSANGSPGELCGCLTQTPDTSGSMPATGKTVSSLETGVTMEGQPSVPAGCDICTLSPPPRIVAGYTQVVDRSTPFWSGTLGRIITTAATFSISQPNRRRTTYVLRATP